MTVLLFGLSKVKIGHGNIVVFAEVWHEIVSWWRGWL
jgi:hypothetical protein